MAFHLDDDNYKIIKPIGKGGMSTVYLAKDKNLDRLVAIKLLHPSMSSDEKNRERLKIEALAIARINHENIVNVYNFVNKDDNSYIVMEYIEGDTLFDFIEKNPISSPELLLAIFFKILKGINYSHQENIIHRDIKPENIMVSNNGKIKIMDFGIASIIGEVHNLTTTGSIMGSPMFMSPEHLTDEKIDKQSDLFSLGIILYWMLTKTFPFSGKNTAQLLNNILKCQYQNPQRLSPLISNDIRVIIKKILQKSKETRYKSSEELLKDIEIYFKNLNFDYKEEVLIYFKNKTAYHRHFINLIPNSYINHAKKLYREKSYPKAMAYAHLTLEYDVENSKAKDIIKKIERGNILKKYIPLSVIALLVILVMGYIMSVKPKPLNSDKNKNRISGDSTQKNSVNIKSIKKYNYKKIYNDYKTVFTALKTTIPIVNINELLSYYVNEKKEINKTTDIKTPLGEHKNNTNGVKILSNPGNRLNNRKVRKIKHKEIILKTRISPKAASVYINNKFYGYGNIKEIKLKSNKKYNLKITSIGCNDYKETLFYKKSKITPLTIRLKWKSAKLKVINSQNGDIFINNNYKGNYKEYNYEIKPNPLSNGSYKLNLKIIKNSKIIFKKNINIKAGQTTIKKI